MAILIQAGNTFPDLNEAFYHRLRWVSAGPLSVDLPTVPLPDGHSIALPGIHTDSGYAAQLDGGRSIAILGNGVGLTRETGYLSTGAITAMVMIDSGGDTRFALFDTAVGTARIMQAAGTTGTSDDRALLASLLTGDDVIMGHETQTLPEQLSGGAGKDLMLGHAGADRLQGDTGFDLLLGGTGRDTLSGGLGNDILVGNAGRPSADRGDVLRGGAGNDLLLADGDGAVLWGGNGADIIAFAAGSTGGTIHDFTPGSDRILLDSGVGDFADLTLTRLANGDTLISAGGISVRLAGLRPAALDADDFILNRGLDSLLDARVSGWLTGWDYAT